LSQRLKEAIGPPAEEAPPVDFKAIKRQQKAEAFAKYLHDAGAKADHVAEAIPLDNFWTQATEGVNQTGSRNWGAPSPGTRPQIVAEMRRLEQAPAPEAAEAAAPAQPPAAAPETPPAAAEPPAAATPGPVDAFTVDQLAKLVQGQGGTAAELRRFNPQQWRELGVAPETTKRVIQRLEALEKAQPFMQGLAAGQ
jgi:hypothetical protein